MYQLKYGNGRNYQWIWKNLTLFACFILLSYVCLLVGSRNFRRSYTTDLLKWRKQSQERFKRFAYPKPLSHLKPKGHLVQLMLTDHHVLQTTLSTYIITQPNGTAVTTKPSIRSWRPREGKEIVLVTQVVALQSQDLHLHVSDTCLRLCPPAALSGTPLKTNHVAFVCFLKKPPRQTGSFHLPTSKGIKS